MSDENLPTKSGGFGEAASKLADTVRHVVDLVAGPDRIRAKAQADAESAVIAARAEAEIEDMQYRAVDRLRKKETRRQKNIESITMKAIEALPPPEEVSKEPVNEDWTSRFFEECQDIGDQQMQQIWARILAGEVARPKSFSPRTLSIVRDLTIDDATLFQKLCGLCWFVPGAAFVPVLHNVNGEGLAEKGITFISLTHLATIGLIEFNSIHGFSVEYKPSLTEVRPLYCGIVYSLKAEGARREFPVGKVLLTAAGQQLLQIAGGQSDDAYKKHALDGWEKGGWKSEISVSGGSDPSAGTPPSA